MCSQVNEFSKMLKKVRRQKKMSAYQLSSLSGVNRKTILDIEKGASPNLITAEKLCKALGIIFVIGGVKND
ncbi:MAG: helix-turn-helix transcriptional regulator [Enterococcus sp.]|nr:helix-turn-helix transcriptional regulator [Enterococcus sp.]